MKSRLKKNPKEWKKYLLSLTVMLSIVVGVFVWQSLISLTNANLAWGFIASVFIVGLFSNAVSGSIYRCGMAFGFRVGQVFGTLLLFVIFMLVIIPLGLCLRLLGKDLLGLKLFSKRNQTYWVNSREPGSINQMH